MFIHGDFEKQFKKLRAGEQERWNERLVVFLEDPRNPLLQNHALHGKYQGCRSINIGGDLRAIYSEVEPGLALFIDIGTHSELYG